MILSLIGKDAELKKYYEEHVQLENRLAELQHRLHLTPEEELEKKRIQKLKLAGKDKIMGILSRYKHPGMESHE